MKKQMKCDIQNPKDETFLDLDAQKVHNEIYET